MSNRHITKEQFSDGTTIDGNRLEKAYQDTQDHYNNLPLKSMTSMVQNQINWNTFTPVALSAENEYYGDHMGYMDVLALHPWVKYAYDGLRNQDEYLDPGNFDVQNKETYKGVGTNLYLNPPAGGEDYTYAWEQTFRTEKPIILKDLSYLVMSDAGWGRQNEGAGIEAFWGQNTGTPATAGWAYYPNLFADFIDPTIDPEGATASSQFQVLVCVDNSLNLDNTDKISKEAHLFNVSSRSFSSDSFFNPTAGGMTRTKWLDPTQCGEQFLEAYPKTSVGGVLTQEFNLIPSGLVINFKNIMLPIHAGAKVRLVFVMPEGYYNEFTYTTNDVDEGTEFSGLASPTGNIWNCAATILEELEAK